ncbi:uncharacterized protein EAF02_001738 [Botrytis sinoallii]|uniref:uncharacterized protein n=1 Tax=Botrytis sinoallii TaxID=1463999 RepID=UPI0018FFEC17|nr:uncharacterized protein EAF02_001738 [Botrytis sinoallii]KAF7891413.1 hypothetical protein EAF02_001738 [Botrytis sinoallii]
MHRKFPRLYGSRPIDAPYQGLGIPLSSTSHNLAMHSDEVRAAICSPPCTCADCEQGYYTCEEQMHPGWFYRRSLSSDEAKQIAASYINVIQQDRKYLTDRLAKYGDIIVNRWKKKSQDKRQALLLEAVPNLCKERWIIPRHGFTPEGKQIPPINSDGQMELRSLETRHHLLLDWHSNVVELWSPYTNQAFSSPPSFSLTNLISLAQTRLEATIDHLWLLQTEPAYMKRYIAAMCHGGAYESTKDMGPGWLVVRGITETIISCWRWGWVKNECERVKSIHDRFRDNIAQGEDLPSKYDKALGALELLVVNDVNRRGDLLGKTISQRPGFSHIYTTTRKSQEHGPVILEVSRKNGLLSDSKYAFENELLDYCLAQLQIKPDIQQTPNTWPKEVPIDHALLFSILENHLAKSNIKEKSRLDEALSNLLSDLAASHEMLAAIRLHRPLSRPRTLDESLYHNDAYTKLGKAFFKDFHEVKAPTGREDMAWLNHSQNTRKALEAFWQDIRKDSVTVWKQNGFTEAEIAEELECISATTTQEYLSAVQAEERQLLAQIEQNQNTKINQKSQKSAKTPTQTTWGTEDPTQTLPTQTKAKDKIRPSTIAQFSPKNPQELANYLANTTVSPPITPKTFVTNRAYEMLSHMYPCTAEDASTKSIEWDLFVHNL